MKHYQIPNQNLWTGRVSNKWLYLHEKVHFTPLNEIPKAQKNPLPCWATPVMKVFDEIKDGSELLLDLM